jgi:hypothetical protein
MRQSQGKFVSVVDCFICFVISHLLFLQQQQSSIRQKGWDLELSGSGLLAMQRFEFEGTKKLLVAL